MSDLPADLECYGNIIITGVESEEVEEVNDAYKDIMEELGERLDKHEIHFSISLSFKKFVDISIGFSILIRYFQKKIIF